MYDMRDRLLDAEARRDQEAMTSLRRQISEAQELAATTARLDAAEKQLRELQARLIAEQVARTQIEQEAGLREDEVKNYQNEWANAVRALRRAREEGKKTDEEKGGSRDALRKREISKPCGTTCTRFRCANGNAGCGSTTRLCGYAKQEPKAKKKAERRHGKRQSAGWAVVPPSRASNPSQLFLARCFVKRL